MKLVLEVMSDCRYHGPDRDVTLEWVNSAGISLPVFSIAIPRRFLRVPMVKNLFAIGRGVSCEVRDGLVEWERSEGKIPPFPEIPVRKI